VRAFLASESHERFDEMQPEPSLFSRKKAVKMMQKSRGWR
jgi:hypothetical protein